MGRVVHVLDERKAAERARFADAFQRFDRRRVARRLDAITRAGSKAPRDP